MLCMNKVPPLSTGDWPFMISLHHADRWGCTLHEPALTPEGQEPPARDDAPAAGAQEPK